MIKSEIIAFREDFEKAMKDLEVKFGLRIMLGTMKYDATHMRATLEAISVDENGERIFDPGIDASARRYLLNENEELKLPERIIGSTVILDDGVTGKVVDFLSSKRTYPLLVDIGGQKWGVAAESIKSIK